MFKKITLKNGVRIISVPSKDFPTAIILVLVGTGSKYEKKDECGISHFLEHMFFKGTKNRPSPKELIEVLDEVGGLYNAFTSQEYTGYWVKVLAEKFDLAIDWISDILFNSTFPEEEIEKEKKVIEEEIKMINDNPMSAVYEILWLKTLYQDQPAGLPICGKIETIEKFTREKIQNYKEEQYVAKNIVVGLAGNFDFKQKIKKVEKIFLNFKKKQPRKRPKLVDFQKKPNLILEKREIEQAHLVLGVKGVNLFDKRKFIQDILATILGGMMSSVLFQEIREKMGIAYYIKTTSHYDLDSGYLATLAGLKVESLEKGILKILEEYKKISEKISPKELKKGKENIKGKLSISLESPEDKLVFFICQELLENKILTPKEIFKKIDKISLSAIKNFAKEIFKTKNLNLAMISPFADRKKIEKILRI
jgi:predicted Zn-dependent peptidase